MSVFLHIGLPKTATTFLQQKVFTDPAFLFLGTDPASSREPTRAEDFLRIVLSVTGCEEALYELDESENRERAKRISASDRPVILSSELLSVESKRADRSEIQRRMKKLFPQAQVIVFFRNPLDYLRSHYLQMVKGFGSKGYSFTFHEFVDYSLYTFQRHAKSDLSEMHSALSAQGDLISRLQYDTFAAKCLEIYGAGNVHFFTYEGFFEGSDYKRLMTLLYGDEEHPHHDFEQRVNKAFSSFEYHYGLYAGQKGLKHYMKYFYAALMRSPLKNMASPVSLDFTEAQEKQLHSIFDPVIANSSAVTGIDFQSLGYPCSDTPPSPQLQAV